MEVLVTGGLGYIGSHTVVALAEAGHSPIIVDNLCNSQAWIHARLEQLAGRAIPFYQVDCTDRLALAQVFAQHPNMQAVVHFAALKAVGESTRHPLEYYQNNLGSLLAVLLAMQQHHVGILVFSSSATVYGEPEKLPVTEATPLQPPTSPYGATKAMAERIIADAVQATPQLRAMALRYFNPVGAHPSSRIGELPQGTPNNLVPYMTQATRGVVPDLKIFGHDYATPDGTPLRDYFHVVDLARAHALAIDYLAKAHEGLPLQFVNVGAGTPVSVLQVVETFRQATGQPLPYRFAPRRAGDVEAIWCDATLAKNLLGWQPEYTLADALLHAWKWEQTLGEQDLSD